MSTTQFTRRDLLKAGSTAVALALLPRPLLADFGGPTPVPVPPIEDPDVKKLALRAIEAARSAGASYADVRLTHTYDRQVNGNSLLLTETQYQNLLPLVDEETMHVGVRALVNGYWGFAASPIWSPDEMARLAQEAVNQAQVNGLGLVRAVELPPIPKVVDGHWSTPVKRDPFQVSPLEMLDYMHSIGRYGELRLDRHIEPYNFVARAWFEYRCVMQDKAFASTEGSYLTQRFYRSHGSLQVEGSKGYKNLSHDDLHVHPAEFITTVGEGWESVGYDQATMREKIRQFYEEVLIPELLLPKQSVEVGRYDAVIEANGVAKLVSQTLGRATELDRALGYEANAGGTSYINDPLAMVGNYQMGAETLTVTADRSSPGGCATVQWDDEGVKPEDYTLIQNGVLTDFHTTRESASWLKDHYTKHQRPVRSHGCAAAATGREAPLTHVPNLSMAPGKESLDFKAMVGMLKSGIAIKDINPTMDFQCLNGWVPNPQVYRVRDGKCVARIEGAALLFRAPELWKGIRALGGPDSVRRFGFSSAKGEPAQETYHTVAAPPALFQQLTLIDVRRK